TKLFFFLSSRRRHTRFSRDWSSDVCSSDLNALRKFVETVGVAKRDNVIEVSLLEFCIREDLNKTAPRVMAVLDPVKLVITNYPEIGRASCRERVQKRGGERDDVIIRIVTCV